MPEQHSPSRARVACDPIALFLSRRASPKRIRGPLREVARFFGATLETFRAELVTPARMLELRAHLATRPPARAKACLTAARGVLRAAVELELVDSRQLRPLLVDGRKGPAMRRTRALTALRRAVPTVPAAPPAPTRLRREPRKLGIQAAEAALVRVTAPSAHPVSVYLATLATGSRRSALGHLVGVARFFGTTLDALPWASLSVSHLIGLRCFLAERMSVTSVRIALALVRRVVRICARLGLMSRRQAEELCSVESLRGAREASGRSLERGEIEALFRSARDAKELAAVAVLYGAGLRRSELARLELADRDGGALRVRGKGGKVRLVPLAYGAARHLDAWLNLRGRAPGPIFGWSPAVVTNLVPRMARRAGISHACAHDLRRTFASDLLDAGVDLVTVQALMGHESPRQTARYDRRRLRTLREAVARLSVGGER